ncbi:MAG: UDP-3-O-(3-hydroxymyristoyl)glucosamine N-acyltransferase [Gemmatimonadaceae bacterium]
MTDAATDSSPLSGERACTLTAEAIAALVGGDLRGARDTVVDSVAPLDTAGPRQLGFLSDPRYASQFERTQAGVVLVTATLADAPGNVPSRIIVEKPQEAMLELLPKLYPSPERPPNIHPTARIGRGARLGAGVSIDQYSVIGDRAVIGDGSSIGAHCVVGDGVEIGAGSRLLPGVTLYPGAQLGKGVIIHSGSRIGADGFGYVFVGGVHAKIPHGGRCVIGDDVEIGANTTVDRGSIGDTMVGAGTKIDNLVQVGHNVRIGRACLIMAQVGIAGSARIEDECIIAGQAGIGGHITIGKGARIAAQAGVFGSVPAGESWSGYPARPHRESLRASAALIKLSGMIRRIEQLLEDREAK